MEIGTKEVLASDFTTNRFRTSEPNKNELGQEDFLQLIVAQIQNQDPFEPVENGAFIGQLAQFGTVDGVNNLNDAFAEFSQGLLNNQTLNAAGLIGKSVLVEGNKISVTEGESIEAYVDSNSQAGVASVQVTNAVGDIVHTEDVTLVNAGLNSFTWDGKDSDGNSVPEGSYFISASVLSGENDISLPTTVKNKIQSVNLNNGATDSIELGLETGNTILFDEVQQISQ